MGIPLSLDRLRNRADRLLRVAGFQLDVMGRWDEVIMEAFVEMWVLGHKVSQWENTSGEFGRFLRLLLIWEGSMAE